MECVSPDRLLVDIPYVIITIDTEEIAERICAQCDKMRVQARLYKELVRERAYLTSWNCIDYPSLLMSCAIKGKDVGDELRKLKETTGKKIIMFYGNCQSATLSALALSSRKIGEKYFILVIPPVQNLSANERRNGIPQGVLDNLDVLYYQHINIGNAYGRKLGSDVILQKMNLAQQVKICIPNVFYKGYFPQLTGNRYQPTGIGEYLAGAGPFPGDANVEKMWDSYTVDELVEKISDEEFYSSDVVIENNNSSIEELKRREELCDVIISDYIQKNLRKERLCFIPNHPRVKVILELLRRAFIKIGIDADDLRLDSVSEPDIQVIPIYPSVKKALKLEFDDDICYEPSLPEKPHNLKQYVDAYIKYCKPLWEKSRIADRE